jgi:hypothetical protein
MLEQLKQKLEDCHRLTNDVGKMFLFALIQLITTVGGGAIRCFVATTTHSNQKTALVANTTFHGSTDPVPFVSVPDVMVKVSEKVALVFAVSIMRGCLTTAHTVHSIR